MDRTETMKTIKEIQIRVRRRSLVACEGAVYSTEITSPDHVAKICASLMDGIDQEIFLVFLLDVRNRVTGYQEVHRGGHASCPVEPGLVFRAAVIQGANAVIVAHNHPSGDATPSEEDRALTKRLKAAGEILGIQLLDHLVIGDDQFESLAQMGEI